MATIRPLLITFNCGRELVKPEVFAQHLISKLSEDPSPEVIIVSLQEIAPIAHAFLSGSYLLPYFDRIRCTVDLTAKVWGDRRYTNLLTRNVGMTALIAFMREDICSKIQWIAAGGVGVGVHEMGNKGAVGLRLGYAVGEEVMVMTFLAAHLAPMEDGLARRNQDWENIVRRLVFTPVDREAMRLATRARFTGDMTEEDEPLLSSSIDNSSEPDSGVYKPTSHLFVAGDLNYRTSLSKPTPQDYASYPQPSKWTDPQHYHHLLEADQLIQEMKAERTFQGLDEATIYFPPTYKYSDTGRQVAAEKEENMLSVSTSNDQADPNPNEETEWLWAKHRWPSWCDRILYLVLPPWLDAEMFPQDDNSAAEFQIHEYTALPLMSTSDHRPVVLSLSIPLKPIAPPDGMSPDLDWRMKPPFPIDPTWRERRAVARRKEIVVGLGAYLALTWKGRVLVAVVVGVLSGWVIIRSLLEV